MPLDRIFAGFLALGPTFTAWRYYSGNDALIRDNNPDMVLTEKINTMSKLNKPVTVVVSHKLRDGKLENRQSEFLLCVPKYFTAQSDDLVAEIDVETTDGLREKLMIENQICVKTPTECDYQLAKSANTIANTNALYIEPVESVTQLICAALLLTPKPYRASLVGAGIAKSKAEVKAQTETIKRSLNPTETTYNIWVKREHGILVEKMFTSKSGDMWWDPPFISSTLRSLESLSRQQLWQQLQQHH